MLARFLILRRASGFPSHAVDSKTEKQVPKAMIGRRLSQEEAERLLAKFE
jgi:hypothetical protein